MIDHTRDHKIFFPNLDGLRFLSFFGVFLMHSFSAVYPEIDLAHWYNRVLARIFSSGDIGVSFFFVLSGFLITFLLMQEKESNGKINVPAFYIRRALRIWPLYYAVLLFGYFIFPLLRQRMGLPSQLQVDPLYTFTFLNNFYKMWGHYMPLFMDVFWSVAIEEQFYLVWPLLFYFVPRKYYVHLIMIIILISTIFRFLYSGKIAIEFHTLGVISDMAVGGLFAFLSLYHTNFMAFAQRIPKWFTATLYILAIVFIVFGQLIFTTVFAVGIKRLIMGTTFALIIVEQNYSTLSFFKIGRWRTVSFLGKYTYGLYCFHCIAIMFCALFFRKLDLPLSGWPMFMLQLVVSLSLCTGMSLLSYRYFESWFLKLKTRFSPDK